MSDAEPSKDRMSRRSALACVAVVASSAVLSACDFTTVGPSDQRVQPRAGFKAFMFVHDEGVEVVISRHLNPEMFNITVRQQGKDVESHEGLNDQTVTHIESKHIEVVYISTPG